MTTLTTQTQRALTKYDPRKGILTIHAKREAEKRARRARDVDALFAAIEAKLTEQQAFVQWWDTEAERLPAIHPGAGRGRKTKTNPEKGTGFIKPEDFGLTVKILSSWRTKLDDPRAFRETLEHEQEDARRRLEFVVAGGTAHVAQNSGEVEWYTPPELIDAARAVMGGIDLDPASCDAANQVVQAAQMFTAADRALDERWDGRVWMNPPYAQPLCEQFCVKLAAERDAGRIAAACVLVNNATETQWFGALVAVASAICFPSGRIRFWHPTKASATPLQGQAVLYIGEDLGGFAQAFAPFGFIASVLVRQQQP